MTYLAHHGNFGAGAAGRRAAKADIVARTAGAVRRVLGSIFQSREEQRDAAIAEFIRNSGGRLTDSIEREIDRRATAPNWSLH
jgi:hypothetical protein